MNGKPETNRDRYIAILRAMTPAQRLAKSFELTEYSRNLLKAGLRRLHPHATEAQFHQLYLDRLRQCHNMNY